MAYSVRHSIEGCVCHAVMVGEKAKKEEHAELKDLRVGQLLRVVRAQRALPRQCCITPQHLHNLHHDWHRVKSLLCLPAVPWELEEVCTVHTALSISAGY